MAQGQVQGGAIPTAINFLKMDQSLPVRTLVRTGIFTHAKVAKGEKGIFFI